MAKPGKRRRGGSGTVGVPAAKRASNMTTTATTVAATSCLPSPLTSAASTPIQHSNSGIETSTEKTSPNKKRKSKRKRLQQESDTRSIPDASRQSRGSSSSSTPSPPPPPTTTATSKNHSRIKEKPARFVHPHLDAELRRLGRSWLSPGDPLFKPTLDRSYRGVRHEPAGSLPQAVHRGFQQSFDSLHEAGLFLYDTVQAGGKRLSRTFVTRTLVGDAGITYKYLGLRLFAHPWGLGESDFRKGPGDGLADALNDPCLADLFSNDGASSVGRSEDNLRGSSVDDNDRVADTLRKVGDLSECMRLRASAMLKEEVGGAGGEKGSCAFNLTLINRMECSGAKRDLKPDPLFSMGKCSVSWHADSCLQDFSTIGVYHCTDPVPAEPDWGIALRVSTEARGGGDGGGDGDGVSNGEKTRRKEADRRLKPGPKAVSSVAASAAEAVPEKQGGEVLTPPLLIPLQSGDAYFLLDDFNHFHEHAVVSGSSTLRYSSTHRVANTDGNTFSHVQKRCEQALAGGGSAASGGDDGQILNLAQVRAEQALLTELESEWLNQFWVQGRRHASLHPWWRGPMALVLATWRELERRTSLTVQRLMFLRGQGGGEGVEPGGGGRAAEAAVVEPAAIAKAFETVLRALEERRESRSRWSARFADPAYRSLAADLAPVVPALWPAEGSRSGDVGEEGSPLLLPQSLGGVVSRLRECYTVVYRAASGGKKAGSAKAIAAGAASNWELFRATSSSSGGAGARKKHGSALGKQQQQRQQQRGVAGQDGLEKKKKKKHAGG
ncbi:unnamed protein product, partial [Ectocarpus sp. 4 AP-2014]